MAKDEILSAVKDRLSQLNINIEDVSDNILKYLLKIEEEVQSRLNEQNKALEIIKNNAININTIAKTGAVSNKTVYKYDLLKDYIRISEAEYNKKLPGDKDKIARLRNRLEEAENTVRLFDMNAINAEVLQHEIELLHEEIDDLNTKLEVTSTQATATEVTENTDASTAGNLLYMLPRDDK